MSSQSYLIIHSSCVRQDYFRPQNRPASSRVIRYQDTHESLIEIDDMWVRVTRLAAFYHLIEISKKDTFVHAEHISNFSALTFTLQSAVPQRKSKGRRPYMVRPARSLSCYTYKLC